MNREERVAGKGEMPFYALHAEAAKRLRTALFYGLVSFEDEVASVHAEIRVGATRRLFGGCCTAEFGSSFPSSFSASFEGRASRLPKTLLPAVAGPFGGALEIGVCGGVVSGSADGCAECVAVTDGTVPSVGVGLLTTAIGVGCVEDCVATEQAEVERAGLAGGTGPVLFADAWAVLTGDGTCGDATCVGVGRGVTFVTGVFEFVAL